MRPATCDLQREDCKVHKNLVLLLFLGALAAGLAHAPAPVAAQEQSPFTLDVRAGYDGAYRVAEWFSVVVTIANNGPDVRGLLEWDFPGQSDETTFRRTVDLPGGSSKRVRLYAFSRDFVQSGRIRLTDGRQVLAEKSVNLEAVDQNRFLIGVVSSDPALLNSLDSLSITATGGTIVRHLDAAALPEHAAALRGVNALFIHDQDSAALTSAQRDALALWVRLGGQLIVSGGANGQKTAAGLADLLPVDVSSGVTQGDLTPLARFSGADAPPQTGAAFSQARPRAGAHQLIPDAALLFRRNLGAGTVIFSAFDLAGLRGWSGEIKLWQQLLNPTDIFAPGTDARQQRSNLLQDVLELPSLGLPSAGVLFCFLIGYILVIGPLNYLLLRRLRRLEWAWLTVPLTVLIFAGGLYVVGFGLRGGQSQIDQVTILQGVEGQQRGFATAFVGLFSPRRSSYTVGFPAESLVSETLDWNGSSSQAGTVLNDDTGVELPDTLVDVASVRTFTAELAADARLSIQSDLHDSGGRVSGEIHNTGLEPIADALVIHGREFQQLGTIAPDASQPIGLSNGDTGSFPIGVTLPPLGVFNRQQLLISLFNSDRIRFNNQNNIGGAAIDPQGVYLLAWGNRPIMPVRLNGGEAAQEGLTLYVIRLNTGE